MLNYYQREENLMNKTEIWLYSEVMKHLIWGHDNRCQHQKVECRGNRPWLRPLTPPLPPQPFWMDKVCPPLLFVHPIGHLPARRTPRHGRPLPFFRDKDPPHPSHPPPLLPRQAWGRHIEGIHQIWNEKNLIKVQIEVCMEEWHLFTEWLPFQIFISSTRSVKLKLVVCDLCK